MNILTFILILSFISVANQIRCDMKGPTSATHEESKGANGPDHDCDQCSQRDS